VADPLRQTGRTTRQMGGAPKDAVYIWPNRNTWVAINLANKAGRSDLLIVSPLWLDGSYIGCRYSGVVVDHATRLSDDQWDIVNRIQALSLQGGKT